MCAYPGKSDSSVPWQATFQGIVRNLRDSLENASAMSYQHAPKKLTTEAIYMIFFLLCFVILTLIGSLIDIYGHLRKEPGKKKLSENFGKHASANEVQCSDNEKMPSETTVWMQICKLFLNCFSVKQNWKLLLSTSSSEDYITCFDGLRAIGVLVVVQTHFSGFYANVLKNKEEKIYDFSPWNFLPLGISAFNSFFIISGFLNGYSASRQYHKSRGKVSWLSLPFQTFIKFTPLEMIVVWFYTFLFPYLGSGPVWPKYDTNPVCRKNWIWNLLYLSNFLPADQQCITQTWYSKCLLQLQIISPLLLIPILRMPKIGYALSAFLCVSSCMVSFVLIIKNNLIETIMYMCNGMPDTLTVSDKLWLFFDVFHSKPYTRLSSYAVGIALGCYIHSLKLSNFKKYSRAKLCFGWITCIFFHWLCFLGIINSEASVYENAAFYSLNSLFYALSGSWIIFLCATDQSEFINKFLSCNVFKILSRLSFPASLLHMFVLEKYFLSFEELIDHSFLKMVIIFAYVYLLVNAFSFIFALIFGIPVLRIHDLFRKIYQKKIHMKKN